jgi:enediyne biosynthesis protein E4
VGAQMRIQSGEISGPTREVHAGSGYWSQDSAVQILSVSRTATALWIRWPGGKVTTANVPPAAKEIQIDQTGGVGVVR